MVLIDVSKTQLLDNGLRFSPDHGVLMSPPSRLKIDPANPRREITDADIREKRADIDGWRAEGHGLLGTGIMEPLKCRWEPGAVQADGSIKKNAKLLVWDGGLKFRATKDDYHWLPVTIDDISSLEARSAALRTSIQNKQHSPVEQGFAFAAEMAETGASLRTLAKKYGVDKSFVENRINLIKTPLDVQQCAAKNPKLMSHALAVRHVPTKEARAEILEYALHGASVREIEVMAKDAIQGHLLKQESHRAPDQQTQSRQTAHEATGGGQMSRGRQVTGASKKEASEAAESAVTSALHNLTTAAQWIEQGGTVPRSHLLILQRRVAELLGQ